MTLPSLFLWITLGIVLQLALYLAIVFRRHWHDHQALRHRAEELNLPAAAEVPEDAPAAPVAWPGTRSFRVARRVAEDSARSISSFYLVPEDGQPLPPYQPGQFLTFRLDVPLEGRAADQIVRCYSLSDAPHAEHYRVSIKRVPAPAGSNVPPGRSSNYFHDQVDVGSLLAVRAPSGHFCLDQGSRDPVVLIAGGIGITPLLSMLNASLAEQPEREVWLYYGTRDGRDAMMQSHLAALAAAHPNFHLRHCFSTPRPEDVVGTGHKFAGRIDISLLRLDLPLKPYHFYLCGPAAMLESLVPALEDWGVPDAHLHFEAFGPASIKRRPSAAHPSSSAVPEVAHADVLVTFARSGKAIPWHPAAGSLLAFAEANGIPVESGCRAGGCGTCQTTIRSGEVSYTQPPDHDPEVGTCLLCVCAPKTSLILEV